MLTSATQVYAADWLLTGPDDCTCHAYREGYEGVWTRYWNGWAVFTVTPAVMRAIVATQQRHTLATLDQAAQHHPFDEAWTKTQRSLPWEYWLGDRVVIDSRDLNNDGTFIEIVSPDTDGRYEVGFGWTWDQVDPNEVHTIHR